MRTLLDFIPILLFFAAYKLHAWFGISPNEAIYFATPVLMLATCVQMGIVYALDRKLSSLHQLTLAMILLLGGVTVAIHDKRFVMWKPTVLYTVIAIAMAVALWGMKKNFLKSTMGAQLDLPDFVWQKLNMGWIGFAAFLAASNAFVVSFYSEEDWVNFKLWGYGFWLVFFVGQGLYIARHLPEDETTDGGPAA